MKSQKKSLKKQTSAPYEKNSLQNQQDFPSIQLIAVRDLEQIAISITLFCFQWERVKSGACIRPRCFASASILCIYYVASVEAYLEQSFLTNIKTILQRIISIVCSSSRQVLTGNAKSHDDELKCRTLSGKLLE